MKTKLTLRIDAQLIAKAKRSAQEHGISVSDMVSHWFSALPERKTDEEWLQEISPQLRSLVGILNPDGQNPPLTDAQLREDYRAYLEEKHR